MNTSYAAIWNTTLSLCLPPAAINVQQVQARLPRAQPLEASQAQMEQGLHRRFQDCMVM